LREDGHDLPRLTAIKHAEKRRDNMDAIRTMDQAVKAMSNREGKYLTFVLAGEE